ncbi:MAG: hypothetical protein SAK29_12485 [Scytonema sp. PMC 1069.18]|nr:hypothetical protein [Scytonema sp. PMC 1069.18]MEC4879768.1 hypothetical protein [Scytonema sp. PMC 1070.18]
MTALDRFWELVFGAIALNPETFQMTLTIPFGSTIATYIILIAGVSQALGQGIVLFINRAKPIRLFLSLLMASLLFAFTAWFWGWSAWLISRIIINTDISFNIIGTALGLAYAPLMLSVLVAFPYLGVPIQIILSIWALLVFVMGLHILLGLGVWQAFCCCILGWVVFQILQRIIGRPVATLGTWVSNNTTTGAQMVTDLQGIEQFLQAKLHTPPSANRTNTGEKEDEGRV